MRGRFLALDSCNITRTGKESCDSRKPTATKSGSVSPSTETNRRTGLVGVGRHGRFMSRVIVDPSAKVGGTGGQYIPNPLIEWWWFEPNVSV
jgi:hypothetical protein